jgi:UDP-GlcNAc:undecaprenyl-phosphate/decaprenyl-phosphate GlcNAc-1-phosphate transferase
MVYLVSFPLALVLSLVLTPLGIRVAWATGYLDHPEARKLHTSATALLGGVVVFVCAAVAFFVVLTLTWVPRMPDALLLGGGASLALGLGMWDDRFGMRPFVKLIGQAICASLVLATGIVPTFGMPTFVSFALAVIAMVALMNAINFLDNMNGMVGGIVAIALAAFAWHSAQRGAEALAAAQLAISGACTGFLFYNFPKARLFLGDAGSLFLGYSLGASALLAIGGATPGWGRLGPLLLLAYPAFDMTFVVITRLREGRKVYEGGKDHTNHRLASVLRCQKRTVILIWVVGAVLSVSGLAVLKLNRPFPALLLSGLWTILLVALGRRLSSVPVVRSAPNPNPSTVPAVASPRPETSNSATS